jgi:3-phenylpropionate/trans-cinnamate dioxygenase ferredoxin subunit
MAFEEVARLADVPPGGTLRVVVGGRAILLANVDGTIYAVDDRCTHEDSSLSLGCLKGEFVSCTLHGSRFSVRTGEPQEPPATEPLGTYPVRVRGGRIEIDPQP